MHAPLKSLSLINLFVEDLPAAKAFYEDIFELELAFGDDQAAAYKLGDTLINLLTIPAARRQLAPATVAGPEAGSRVQLAIVVDDIDARCAELVARGVPLINGPEDRPWGMRTACFADPAGHNWEFAQPVGGQD
jgi:catechol 2,3-dioxygenase-like lactoylglutathione lyase family enzyme